MIGIQPLHLTGGQLQASVILMDEVIGGARRSSHFPATVLAGRVATAVGANAFPLTEPEAEVSDNAHRFRPRTINTHVVVSFLLSPVKAGGSTAPHVRV